MLIEYSVKSLRDVHKWRINFFLSPEIINLTRSMWHKYIIMSVAIRTHGFYTLLTWELVKLNYIYTVINCHTRIYILYLSLQSLYRVTHTLDHIFVELYYVVAVHLPKQNVTLKNFRFVLFNNHWQRDVADSKCNVFLKINFV